MIYVDGESEDYIYTCCACSCNERLKLQKEKGTNYEDCPIHPDFIEDYGSISNEAIIEIFAKRYCENHKDTLLNEYMLKNLAEKLNVKLRDKPLTWEEQYDLMAKSMNEYKEEIKREE